MVLKERMSEALQTITREFVDVLGNLLKWNPIGRSLFRLAGSEPRRLSDFVGSMKFVAIKRATMVELRFTFLTGRRGHAVNVKYSLTRRVTKVEMSFVDRYCSQAFRVT